MIGLQHLHYLLSVFCAVLTRMQHALCLPLGNPLHRRMQIPSEHQVVVVIVPVLLRLLPVGGSELLRANHQCLLHEYPVIPSLPRI